MNIMRTGRGRARQGSGLLVINGSDTVRTGCESKNKIERKRKSMKKMGFLTKRALAGALSALMILTSAPISGITAYADEPVKLVEEANQSSRDSCP